MRKNVFWQIGAAAAVLGGIVGSYAFGAYRRRKDNYSAELKPKYRKLVDKNLLTPADWVFYTLWPTIYAGTIGLSIHQALPEQADNPRYVKARPWLALSYGFNGLFGYFFSRQDTQSIIGSNVVTILNLTPALMLHRSLEIGESEVEGAEKYLRIPVSLYTGWLSVASVVAGSGALIAAGQWKHPKRDEGIAAGVLAGTAGLGYLTARQLNDPVYLVPFVAGFSGIAAKQWGKNNLLAGVAGGLAFGELVAMLWSWRESLLPKKQAYSEYYDLGDEFEMIDPTPRQIRRERMKEVSDTPNP